MKALHKSLKKNAIRIGAFLLTGALNAYRKFRPLPCAIYFCYNQSIHHIHHSIYIAVEMSRIQKKYPVVILSTSREASEIIEKELEGIPHSVIFRKVRHLGYNRIHFNVFGFVLLCRLHIHKPRAVVVTDYYDNIFRQLGVETFWTYAFHGPENRGFTQAHIRDYDLIFIPGVGELARLESKVGKLNNYIITGYSKFDYFRYHQQASLPLFRDSRPVVIYNPHFDEAQSSFFDQGQELLQALDACAKYNIIFMPHPDLVRRYPKEIAKVDVSPNLILSERTRINFDYMNIADIYITDVSSSVFEWLRFNKPVIFFNTKKKDKHTYPSWVCGRIVESVPEMLGAIEDSLRGPDEFASQRKRMFSETFSSQDKNASRIAAEGLWDKLEELAYKPQFFFFGGLSEKKGLRGIGKLAKELNQEKPMRFVCKEACSADFSGPENEFKQLNIFPFKRAFGLTPLRWSYKAMTWIEYELFDFFASRCVENSSPVYAVQGMALNIFKKAKKLGLKKFLIASSLHIERVWSLHKEEEKILGYDYEWLGPKLKDKILREYELADLIIVPSELTLETFTERGFAQERLKLMPREIDQDYFRRRQAKQDKVFRVLFVGRITPQKGIHYLVQAFRELNLPDSELILFGSTATRAANRWFKKLISNKRNIVTACGDARDAYEQASVLVHPSLQDNYGLAVPEALTYGLPVIVTENTGAKDLVKDGVNGFIIPIRDTEAIKEKIRFYYRKKDARTGD